MSNNLLVVLMLVAIAAVIYLLSRSKPNATGSARSPRRAPATSRENMLQIVLSPKGACEAARLLKSHRYHKNNAPPLPLANCTNRNACHCRFQMVADWRIAERRTGAPEKRDGAHPEENPRPESRGRRSTDKLFNHDGK